MLVFNCFLRTNGELEQKNSVSSPVVRSAAFNVRNVGANGKVCDQLKKEIKPGCF